MERLLLIAVLGSISLFQVAAGQTRPDVEKLVQAVINAKELVRAEFAYRELFKAVGPEGLAALRVQRNDSIAIQAAWEEVELTVPEKEAEQILRPDRNKLEWFVGFLEGRARIKAPSWWSAMLLDARANQRYNIYPGQPTPPSYHKAGLDDLYAPPDTSLKKEGGKVVLKVGSESVQIPEDLLQKLSFGKMYGHIIALIKPEKCFVAVHDNVGYSYDLACIDRSSGRLLWKSRVWGCWWGHAFGKPQSWVSVVEQDDRIFVFGIGTGMYAEAFRSADGSNLFRFSNSP